MLEVGLVRFCAHSRQRGAQGYLCLMPLQTSTHTSPIQLELLFLDGHFSIVARAVSS